MRLGRWRVGHDAPVRYGALRPRFDQKATNFRLVSAEREYLGARGVIVSGLSPGIEVCAVHVEQ
jgi:hypothetical protein